MKQTGIATLLSAALLLGGCGGGNSSSNAGNVNGNWNASLMSSASSTQPVFAFTTNFTESSGSSLSVTHFTFTTSSPCFAGGETETGGFVLSGNFNGSVTGALQMAVQSGNPSGNALTLQGQVNNNTISGTWVLSGVTSGCTGSGNFTMTKM
jgi:hypothetical protein